MALSADDCNFILQVAGCFAARDGKLTQDEVASIRVALHSYGVPAATLTTDNILREAKRSHLLGVDAMMEHIRNHLEWSRSPELHAAVSSVWQSLGQPLSPAIQNLLRIAAAPDPKPPCRPGTSKAGESATKIAIAGAIFRRILNLREWPYVRLMTSTKTAWLTWSAVAVAAALIGRAAENTRVHRTKMALSVQEDALAQSILDFDRLRLHLSSPWIDEAERSATRQQMLTEIGNMQRLGSLDVKSGSQIFQVLAYVPECVSYGLSFFASVVGVFTSYCALQVARYGAAVPPSLGLCTCLFLLGKFLI